MFLINLVGFYFFLENKNKKKFFLKKIKIKKNQEIKGIQVNHPEEEALESRSMDR